MESVTKKVFRVIWGSGFDKIEEIIVADNYEKCLKFISADDFYMKEEPDMIQILHESASVI